MYVEAYARAFTKLLVNGEAAFDGLVETTRRLYYELLLSERLGEVKDASVLAAGIALTSGKRTGESGKRRRCSARITRR